MAKVTATVEVGNDAAQTPFDIGYLLQKAGEKLMNMEKRFDEGSVYELFSIYDENGNKVGQVAYIGDALPLSQLLDK